MNWKKAAETFMTCMGFIGSIATIPTVIKIWFTHSNHADGQSIITWSFYAIIALLWIIYGFYNKRFAIWATNVIYLILYIIIVVGIVLKAGWAW